MESMLEVTTPRIRLREVNAHLTCHLCKGYYIDATTIVECLHSFCRSCIIQHLRVKSYCPICDMMINKAKPNIKPDKTLQDIVYKLVPGLHRDEMRRRREFYQEMAVQNGIETSPQGDDRINNRLANHPNGGCGNGVEGVPFRHNLLTAMTPEQRGEDNERVIYNVTDPISLSLEYCNTDCTDAKISSILSIKSDGLNGTTLNGEKGGKNGGTSIPPTRYLQCPAGVSVRLLKKFLIGKFDIDTQLYHIDILYKRVPLPSDYKLMDIAYIYSWKRNAPMKLFYRITDIQYALDNFTFIQPKIEPKSEKIENPIKIEKTEKPGKLPLDTSTPAPINKSGLLMIKPNSELSDPYNNNNVNLNDRNKLEVKSENELKVNVKSIPKSKTVKPDNKVNRKNELNLKVQHGTQNVVTKRKTPDRVNNNRKSDLDNNKKLKQVKDVVNKTVKNKSDVKNGVVPTNNNVIKSDIINKSDEKPVEKLEVKLEESDVKKVEKKERTVTPTLVPSENVTLNSSGSLIIDEGDEEDKEKSVFLNTFELTSIKSLSPKNSESSKSPKSSPSGPISISTPLSIKTSSPRKLSPKSPGSTKSSKSVSPNTSKSPKELQQAEALKNYNNSLQSVLSKSAASSNTPSKSQTLHPETPLLSFSQIKQNLTAKINGVDKPKRKYTFKNGRQPASKKPKLHNGSDTPKSSPISPTTTSINSIVQNIRQQSSNMKKIVAGNSSQSNALKRKISSKAEKLLLEETRACLDKILKESDHPKPGVKVGEKPGNNPLKSLFDNCNLNIPSSLSITLTEGPSDKDQISTQNLANVKRQSPPVNMYIEIFKIPDKNEPIAPGNSSVAPGSSGVSTVTSVASTVPTGSSVNSNSNVPVGPVSEVTSSNVPNCDSKTVKTGDLNVKSETVKNVTVPNSNGNVAPSPTVKSPCGSPPIETKPLKKPLFPINTKTPVTSKVVDSSTGFQKMFEEAIKKTEAAKPNDVVNKVIRKFDLKPGLKKILPKLDNFNGILALDLSSPNIKPQEAMWSKPPPTLIVPKRPNLPAKIPSPKKSPNPKNPVKISPQSNLISSSGETNGVSSTLSPPIPTSTPPAPVPTINPSLVEQFNLPNLAQLRQVMLYRQSLELRNRLFQQNQSNESLMRFENYLKNLQQTAAAAATTQKK